MHGLRSGVPGPSAEREPVAETLERGGGARRGGTRGRAPPTLCRPRPSARYPAWVPGSQRPLRLPISHLARNPAWPESPDVSATTAQFLAEIKCGR